LVLLTNTELRRSKVSLLSGLGYTIRRALGGRLAATGVVGLLRWMVQGGALNAQLGQQPVLDAGHQRADGEALLEPLLEVARLVQLVVQPALGEGLG
jgi:hypothetical protein